VLNPANIHVLLSSRATGGQCAICVLSAAGLPAHLHRYEDAWFYVLEGEFLFEIAREPVRAAQGTSLFVPRNTVYSIRNIEAGRLLVIAQPGGLDLFLQYLVDGRLALETIYEKHGIEIAESV
jgi:mannose-6-phosphate isomerase-like protein (cupin superfamily)